MLIPPRIKNMQYVSTCLIVAKMLPTLFMLSEDKLLYILWESLLSIFVNVDCGIGFI